ncbi:GntR family transcriptional regulator [Agromyces seonyuensis]|uniref:GntR family transcriptional regulator n=1 Tax=Agromyces seonyuensis TaxID=2662446 RepID=A0A6I4NWL0_9MICO|nr:GntR family transcriptional regulator [Agromyces seonyuensis]MWB98561.1 GntR family transcriptional regulator [Agromyces seonyuensis]
MTPSGKARTPEPADAGAATVVARIHETLRHEILEGELEPGTPLREESLAARFGVSRHSVRSGIGRLVRERLAIEEPYRGVRVASFGPEEVVALQQLRGALETEAVRIATERRGSFDDEAAAGAYEVLDRFRALGEREQAGEQLDWVEVERTHAEFHAALVEASESPRIIAAHRTLSAELQMFLLHVRPDYDLQRLIDDHVDLIEAIRTVGESAVRDHLAVSTALFLERAAEQGATPAAKRRRGAVGA